MAMQCKTIPYGGSEAIGVAKTNLAEIGEKVGKHLKPKRVQVQASKLPDLTKAQALYSRIKAAKDGLSPTWMKCLQVNHGLDRLR